MTQTPLKSVVEEKMHTHKKEFIETVLRIWQKKEEITANEECWIQMETRRYQCLKSILEKKSMPQKEHDRSAARE